MRSLTRHPKRSAALPYALALLLFLLGFLPNGSAQNYVLDIKNLDLSDYPTIRGDIWTRNPDGLDTSKLRAEEAGKELKLKYNGKKDSTLSKKNKCIVFLVLNPGNSIQNAMELNWYKRVLKGALSGSTIKKGDKIEIMDFNQQMAGQLLYPSSLSLTDNVDELHARIDNIKLRSNPSACAKRGSLVMPAIDQAMTLIRQKNLDMPAGIVVLSDDVVCVSNQLEDPVDKSRKLGIPIYSITLSAFRSPWNSIKSLTEKTFGEYYQDNAPGGTADASINQLIQYLGSFLVRNKGLLYKYEWKTDLPKDGKPHTITLRYEEINTEYSFTPPSKNPIEWVVANPLLAVGILILIGLLAYGGSVYVKKQKKLQIIQREQLESLQREQEAKAAQHAQQLQQHQREVDQIKERERRERERMDAERRASEKASEEKELIRQMKLRGVLPSMDCMAPGTSFVFTVSKPEVMIGRGADCDLVLSYPTVSKRHCKINFVNNQYMLEDLGSSNGTTVNSRPIQKVILKHGDVIRLGEVVINFRM